MISCPCPERLRQVLDGRLSQAEAEALAAHVEECTAPRQPAGHPADGDPGLARVGGTGSQGVSRRPTAAALLAMGVVAVVALALSAGKYDRDVAFAPESDALLSARTDGTVKWWEAASEGEEPGEDQGLASHLLRLAVVLLVSYPLLYLAVFAHELGHALLGRCSGFAITSFGLGVARPLWVGHWGGTRVYFCLKSSLQGITFSLPTRLGLPRRNRVVMLLGGVLANALLALAGLALLRLLPWGGDVWWVLASLNGFMAVGNLLPLEARLGGRTLRTDGGQILRLLRGGAAPTGAVDGLQKGSTLRGLWEAVGDWRILYIHLLETAGVRAELGDVEQAEQMHADAEALPVDHSPFTRAYGATLSGIIARHAGRLAASAAAFDAAEGEFRALGDETGLFLVAWGRAELRLKEGDAAGAAAALDELASRPPAAQALRQVGLLAARLRAHAALPDEAALTPLVAEYETTRRRHPSAACDVRVYRALGRRCAQAGDWPRAEPAYLQALAAARRLYAALAEMGDRKRFAAPLDALLEETRECLRQRGLHEEADRLTSFAAAEEGPHSLAEQRGRRQQRLGWALLLGNVVCVVVLAGLTVFLQSRAKEPLIIASLANREVFLLPPTTVKEWLVRSPLLAAARLGEGGALLLFLQVSLLVLGTAYMAARWAVVRLVPSWRGRGALSPLSLALAPWIVWLGGLAWLWLGRP